MFFVKVWWREMCTSASFLTLSSSCICCLPLNFGTLFSGEKVCIVCLSEKTVKRVKAINLLCNSTLLHLWTLAWFQLWAILHQLYRNWRSLSFQCLFHRTSHRFQQRRKRNMDRNHPLRRHHRNPLPCFNLSITLTLIFPQCRDILTREQSSGDAVIVHVEFKVLSPRRLCFLWPVVEHQLVLIINKIIFLLFLPLEDIFAIWPD